MLVRQLLSLFGSRPDYVMDVRYYNDRIAHAKQIGIYDNIVFWVGSSFRSIRNNEFISRLENIVSSNHLYSNVGSEQPILVKSENNKPAILSDGYLSSLYTDNISELIPINTECTIIFVFKPSQHLGQSTRTYFQGKLSVSNLSSIKEGAASNTYAFGGMKINGVNNNMSIRQPQGISDFVIMAVRVSEKGTWLVNDTIGNRYDSIVMADAIKGVSLFGNYEANATNFYTSKSKFEFYELIIINKKISYSLIQTLKQRINTYYQVYDSFNWDVQHPLEGLSDIECAFSLWRLNNTYGGSCFRLRRSSDNSESDFGFVNDFIDVTAISLWANGSDIFVRTWYDQGQGENFNQTSNVNQFQFFTSGGGVDGTMPYIKAISANSTSMTRASTLTSASVFRSYVGVKWTTDQGLVWAAGGSTNYVNFANTTSNFFAFNKRASGANYIKTADHGWRLNGGTVIQIACVSNTANTPSDSDIEFLQNTYQPFITADLASTNFPGTNTMAIGGVPAGTYFNTEIYELIIIKNTTHNKKEIENNMVKRLHKLD